MSNAEKTDLKPLSRDSVSSAASDGSAFNDLCPPAVTSKGFRLGDKLGFGAFSTVYKAFSDQMPGQVLACKRFDLTDGRVNEEWRQKCLKQEMKIMLKLKHPNIIKAYDVIKTRKAAFIFMKFAKNGNIAQYIEKLGKPLRETKAKVWFGDIMSAIHYLHMKGIAHRDIKLENFLLDENETALLTDFGFSCMALDKSNDKLMKGTNCGTDLYKAPEIQALKDGHVYDAKVADIYSMGVCLFEMLNFLKPFGEEFTSDYVKRQISRKYKFRESLQISKFAKELIDLLLEPDPNKRISAENVIKHKWLKVIEY